MIENESKLWDKYQEKIRIIKEADDCGCIKMNDWEMEFIDSIDYQLDKNDGKILSWKQSKILNKIYERVE